MAKIDFNIHYTGDALKSGRMPISELAPALLGVSAAFQAIQEMEQPGEAPISIDINATKPGSFIVDLIIVNGRDLLQRTIDILSGDQATAALALAEFVDIFNGAIKLIKKLAGHKVKSVNDADNGQVTIKLDDETSITVPASHLRAYRNIEVRKSIEESVKPVKNDGIDGVEFSSSKSETVSVREGEIDAFDSPKLETEELAPSISEVYLQLVSVAFEHGKWKFSDGNNQFFAKIEDEEFLTSVKKNNVQFGSTDSLKVRLRTMQGLTATGLRAEYYIEKVIEHRKGARQLSLDFEDND